MSARPRRIIVLAALVPAAALLLSGLLGIALLIAGFASWVHGVDVAAAWSRTLGGIGLIGGSAGLMALGWLAVERAPGPDGGETAARQGRKFVAVIGILLALICLPFAAAIHTTAQGPWLGNRALPGVVLTSSSGTEDGS